MNIAYCDLVANDPSFGKLLKLMCSTVLCSNSICYEPLPGIQQRWLLTDEYLGNLCVDRLQYGYEITI